MNNRKGFTLTELLVVIGLIAVLGTIIIYSTIGINNSSKDLQYERMVENIKNSARTYVNLYPEDFSELYSSRAFTYIALSDIISAGMLDEEIINPYTNKQIDLTSRNEGYIKVYIDGESKEMNYVYPVSDDEYNTLYWLQYEPIQVYYNESTGFTSFYAYDGLEKNTVSTKFSFADEQGNIVKKQLADASYLVFYKNKFKLDYELKGFESCTLGASGCPTQEQLNQKGASINDYYLPSSTGNYEIKYTWSYDKNGTTVQRTNTRKIIVYSSSESEKDKASTTKTTASTVETTVNSDGITYDCPVKDFDGSTTNFDTGVRLLTGESFTVYIQGRLEDKINSGKYVLIDNYAMTGGAFRVETSDGRLRLLTYMGSNLWNDTNFAYTFGKTFRMVFGIDVSKNVGMINVRFIPDISNPTVQTGAARIYYISDTTMFIGSRKTPDSTGGYRYMMGHLDKLAVYNMYDLSLINK